MDGFIQVVVKGTASGQEIRNVLYYGNGAGVAISDIGFAHLTDILPNVGEYLDGKWEAGLADSYNAYEIEARAVDVRGVALDIPTYAEAVDWTGARAAATDTVGLYAVLAFRTRAEPTFGYRSLKRSYLAYGPLTSTDVDGDGAVNAGSQAAIAPLLPALAEMIAGGTVNYAPVRLGRTVAPEAPAVGFVLDVALRPYASFRRSRLRRPTG